MTSRAILVHVSLFAAGAILSPIAIVCLAAYATRDVNYRPPAVSAEADDSLTMPNLVKRITPPVQQGMADRRNDVVRSIGNPVYRQAAKIAYPEAINIAPKFIGLGVDAGVNEISKFDVRALIKLLDDSAKARREAGFKAGPDDDRLLNELRTLTGKVSGRVVLPDGTVHGLLSVEMGTDSAR